MRGQPWRDATILRQGQGSLAICAACACLLAGVAGCGGGSSPTRVRAQPAGVSIPVWAAKTQQLCREKQAAIASLGYVHITFAGIARAGLTTVKRSLASYLGRLLMVLHTFAQRQRQLATPPPLASLMKAAKHLDKQSQAATIRLQRAVARAPSANALSADFRVWLATLQRLTARGNALAQRLNLPECRSDSSATSP